MTAQRGLWDRLVLLAAVKCFVAGRVAGDENAAADMIAQIGMF